MIKAHEFLSFLIKRGYIFFSGVPCSILEPVYNELNRNLYDIEYLPAVNENSAIGVASGAYVAGKKSGILIQNSGLGNIINPLTSFNLIYKIPVLMFITWRGYRGKDSPEHLLMGKNMLKILKVVGIDTVILTSDYKSEINLAIDIMEKREIPVAVIIKKGLIN